MDGEPIATSTGSRALSGDHAATSYDAPSTSAAALLVRVDQVETLSLKRARWRADSTRHSRGRYVVMTDEQSFRQQVMGRRILARRDRAGMSQRDLGKRLGVSPAAVAKWEAGTSVPRWPAMWALAEALGVSARWLVEPLVVDFGEAEPGEDAHDLGPSAS